MWSRLAVVIIKKIAIIDGKVAFCGGLDLSNGRWDTREHASKNHDRLDTAGQPYGPFHDMQCVVDGEAAAAITDLIEARWESAACRKPLRPDTDNDPWPDGVTPLFENHSIAIARTVPPLGERDGVHEIQQLYIDMINEAEKSIYLENQYFTSQAIAEALVARLQECPDLEVIMMSSKEPFGFLEAKSMASGRRRFMNCFKDQNLMDRVRFVYPRVPDGSAAGPDVEVHAKVTIIDDRFFRVGSANLNNRSMGTDGECDLALEASSEADRKTISRIRNDLMAEHLGLSIDQVAEGIEQHGNIRSLIDARKDQDRTLAEIDFGIDPNEQVAGIVQSLTDPERPGDIAQFTGDMLSSRPAGIQIRGRYMLAGAAAGLGLLYLLVM